MSQLFRFSRSGETPLPPVISHLALPPVIGRLALPRASGYFVAASRRFAMKNENLLCLTGGSGVPPLVTKRDIPLSRSGETPLPPVIGRLYIIQLSVNRRHKFAALT